MEKQSLWVYRNHCQTDLYSHWYRIIEHVGKKSLLSLIYTLLIELFSFAKILTIKHNIAKKTCFIKFHSSQSKFVITMIYCTYLITIFRYNFNLASCPPLESINPVSFKCNTNGVFKVTVSLLIDDTLYFKAARPSCYLRKLIVYVMYVSMWKIDHSVLSFEVWMKKKKR